MKKKKFTLNSKKGLFDVKMCKKSIISEKSQILRSQVKKGQKNNFFFKNYKKCIDSINLTNFHIYMSFFEEIVNFSIFAHFVLDNVENGRFCSTMTQK